MNWQRIYDELIDRGKNRSIDQGEWHHILPRSMSGSDDKSNLVHLTYREHFIAHALLYKIHLNSQMAYALCRMRNSKYDRGCSSKTYEYFRKMHSFHVSEWSKDFMKDKVMMRNKITKKCSILTINEYDASLWDGVNKGYKLTKNPKCKNITIFKNSNGEFFRLNVNDPKIKNLNLVGVGCTKNATIQAAKIQKSRPWYSKTPLNKEAILSIPSLYDWFITKYDPNKPKATGLRKWLTWYNISKSKKHVRAWNEIKNGWVPDSNFYEVYNEIIKNRKN